MTYARISETISNKIIQASSLSDHKPTADSQMRSRQNKQPSDWARDRTEVSLGQDKTIGINEKPEKELWGNTRGASSWGAGCRQNSTKQKKTKKNPKKTKTMKTEKDKTLQ